MVKLPFVPKCSVDHCPTSDVHWHRRCCFLAHTRERALTVSLGGWKTSLRNSLALALLCKTLSGNTRNKPSSVLDHYIIELRSVHGEAYLPSTVQCLLLQIRCLLLYVYTTVFCAVLTHASSYTNVAPRALTHTCVAGLLYSPVRPLVGVEVFRVLQTAINTSKAGPNVSLTPIDPN